MGTGLIFIGKVKIDIRFFIAIKAQESLKWDLVTILVHLYPAVRTFFMGKVKSGTIAAISDKFAVLALTAKIMRRQRVDL